MNCVLCGREVEHLTQLHELTVTADQHVLYRGKVCNFCALGEEAQLKARETETRERRAAPLTPPRK